jgi:thiosulfate/3-mercaptopyruvate sulfurtransferase
MLLALFALVSCATPSTTKTYETGRIRFDKLQTEIDKPIVITENTVILDARAPFEFALAHAPGSINLQWTDFTNQLPNVGPLKKDLSEESRRLARYGIDKNSHVLILDQGQDGFGEAGRLAWTLLYFGLDNIQVARFDKVGLRFNNVNPAPIVSKSYWKPQYIPQIEISKKQFIDGLNGRATNKFHIIDVRSREEYFSKNKRLQYEVPDLGAIHIHWREFYLSNGRPNPHIVNQLRAIGVGLNDQVVVISEMGRRSGAVTFALLSLGYKKASNFSGGYNQLLRR